MINEFRLLLADDDGLVRSTFSKGLRDAGFTVFEAADGEEALDLAEKHVPDLAILDIRMPGLSGFEVADRLRSFGMFSVFLSAYDDQRTVDDAVARGALGYLVKPVDVPRAVPTIRAAIKRAEEAMLMLANEGRLTRALDTANVVNYAVGLLMERYRVGRRDAFEMIRRRARDERRSVREVAGELLDAAEKLRFADAKTPEGSPDS